MEDYIVVAEPTTNIKVPEHNDNDFNNRCFEFRTKELKSSGINATDYCESFTGTEIYYKIYNNYNTLESERAKIETLENDDETKEKATTTMISTYGFKPLKCESYNNSPLIPAVTDETSQKVYIRLTDYYDLEEFKAVIKVDDEEINNGYSQPLRTDGKLTFNFGQTGSNNTIPGENSSNEEQDYSIGTATTDGVWMVSMFAVGVAFDVTLTQYYSAPLYLGCVDIKENSSDN